MGLVRHIGARFYEASYPFVRVIGPETTDLHPNPDIADNLGKTGVIFVALKVAVVFACVVVLVLVFAATRPNSFRVQRSVLIRASREKVFPLINDFHKWPDWAPQDKEDRSMKRSYSGNASGVGAVSEWVSNGTAGKGRMWITESVAPERISVRTDFAKPFEAHNLNQFILESQGTATKVTWSLDGSKPYFMKLIGIFVSMDRLMGKHFESGLHNLKALTETD